jgi:hypothetical protein
VTDQLTWAQRARNWSLRCSVTLPGCPWAGRLLEQNTDSGVRSSSWPTLLSSTVPDRRSSAIAPISREAEKLLFQFEHRGR